MDNHNNALNKLQTEIELLKKALNRERVAREKAEELLDNRANTLFQINQKLLQQYESVAKKSAEIEFLHSVASMAEDNIDVDQALKSFLDLVCNLCQWPIGHIYRPKREDTEISITSARIWNLSDDKKFSEFVSISENYIFKPNIGLPGRVFHSGKSYWIKDISIDENFPRQKFLSRLNVKSAFAVPIKIASETVAIAEFFAEKLTEKDESLITIVEAGATQLSTLLERYQTQKQLKDNFEALKQTQLQLVQSEKMASLGTIAAGVAHEINNPISFVLSNTESLASYSKSIKKILAVYEEFEAALVRKDSEQELSTIILKIDKIKKEEDIAYISNDFDLLIKETLEGILRVKEIVQSLKTFSRVDEAEVKEADVNECIESTLKIIWNELKYKCSLEKTLGNTPKIMCYPGQLVQVFTNLLLNSAQAIESRGVISICTTSDEKEITIIVSDTGKGISEENLKNIFTPFFTTKSAGKGTGLGLSISYGIVKKHGGTIDVESTPGQGTKFTIKLPLVQKKEGRAA